MYFYVKSVVEYKRECESNMTKGELIELINNSIKRFFFLASDHDHNLKEYGFSTY